MSMEFLADRIFKHYQLSRIRFVDAYKGLL